MKQYIHLIIFLSMLLDCFTFAQGKTITITGIKNIQDTVLFSGDTDKNSTVTTELRAGMSGPNNTGIHRALLRFNLSSIPSNAVISTVTVQLICTRIPKRTQTVSMTQELHRVTNSWTGIATWIFRSYPSMKWATPGGEFVAVPSASKIVDKTGQTIWTGSGLVSDVQGWIKKTIPNYGWILLGDEKISRSVRNYGSSSDTANSPVLSIGYSIPPSEK